MFCKTVEVDVTLDQDDIVEYLEDRYNIVIQSSLDEWMRNPQAFAENEEVLLNLFYAYGTDQFHNLFKQFIEEQTGRILTIEPQG